jgi:hypothetical protein
MKLFREIYSAGKTHSLELSLRCGHRIERSTNLNEDQTAASFLCEQILKQWINRNKGLPIIDFDIKCPVCHETNKYSETDNISITWNNNLRYAD